MSNLMVNHNGAPPLGYDVASTGTKIVSKSKFTKQITITNASDTPVYLACWSNDANTNTAVVGSGIYLAAEGGAYEFNNTNMCFNDIWAIHEATGETKRVCVQLGS